MSFVTAKGLNKSFVVGGQHIHVLRDLDLDVAKGEMLAIVGASGVGKSTLLHLLGGLDRSDSGAVHVADEDLTAMPDPLLVEFRNRHVGFVFQFHHLMPEFDAAENVEMPMRIARMPRDEARRRAAELLTRVGLGERLVHRPGMLSGGEQQRVAVARALANRPALILADEPTGNLDEATADLVFAEFLRLVRDEGSAALVATHNERIAAKMDRVLRLHDGLLT